jgi:VWFA-related protein
MRDLPLANAAEGIFFMKQFFVRFSLLIFTLLAVILPLETSLSQDSQPTRSVTLEINGVDSTQLPQAVVSVAVLDNLGQPVRGLTAADFTITGELADRAQIVSVENVTDDNLAFGVVLAIDISSSMAGTPIAQAKAAATAFVDSIGPNDPVAIMTFGNTAQVVQGFTSDKDVLRNAIAGINFGGETNLYDGSVRSIEQAAAAPVPRHTVIILSDGAHYLVEGRAENSRENALNTALTQGVPVYTIGLGYGTDRSYLQALAEGTNARYFESPTPEQLVEIYTDLAALFRSLYIVTLSVDVPLDGTEYTLEMRANTPFGESVVGQGILRAPIPVPLVSIEAAEPAEGSPENTLAFNVNVVSDDPLTGGQYTLLAEGAEGSAAIPIGQAAPAGVNQFNFMIDPFVQAPGSSTLRVEVTDDTGDVGTAETEIEIPALPAIVTLSPELASLGELTDITTVTVDLQEQSPTTSVHFFVDDTTLNKDLEAPFTFDIDPASFAPGEHTLRINVESASGATNIVEQTFTTAALPPEITVTGLTAGEVLEEARTVDIEVGGRVPVQSVTYSIDGNVIGEQSEAPFNIELRPLAFVPDQTLTLRIEAANSFGTTNAVDIPFSFSMSPFLTATPPTNTPTSTPTFTNTPTPTIDVPATNAVATAVAQTTLDAQATSDTLSTATAVVEATANAVATDNAISTENAAEALTATFEAEATSNAQATLDSEATLAEQNTLEAQQTATAEVALTQEQATTDAAAANNAESTSAVETDTAQTEIAGTDTAATEATLTELANTEVIATEFASTNVAETQVALTDNAATEAASGEENTATAEQRALRLASTQTATALFEATNVAQTLALETEVIETEAAATNIAATDIISTEAAETEVIETDTAAANIAATDAISTETAATENAITEVAMLQLSASPTKAPTNTPTEAPSDTPPTETPTEVITEEATSEPTEEVTEEITEEPTEAVTETQEETPLATASSLEPTVTTGAPQEVVVPGSAQTLQDQLPIIVVCGGLILLLILILIVMLSRRRRNTP